MPHPTQHPSRIDSAPASLQDLQIMEGLAQDLLRPVPIESLRQYGYATDNCSIAMLSTCVFEDEQAMGSMAGIYVAQDSVDNVVVELVLGYDNQPKNPLTLPDGNPGVVAEIIQDLIDVKNPPMDPIDKAILGHLQSAVMYQMIGTDMEEIAKLSETDKTVGFEYLGDAIRSRVASETRCAVKEKLWRFPIGERDLLTVVSQELDGPSPDVYDVPNMPKLRIGYDDYKTNTTRLFSRTFSGLATLEVSTVGMEAYQGPEAEEEVAAFIDELDDKVPRKHDVELLISKLLKGIDLDGE